MLEAIADNPEAAPHDRIAAIGLMLELGLRYADIATLLTIRNSARTHYRCGTSRRS
jgi:hypothetical protein